MNDLNSGEFLDPAFTFCITVGDNDCDPRGDLRQFCQTPFLTGRHFATYRLELYEERFSILVVVSVYIAPFRPTVIKL